VLSHCQSEKRQYNEVLKNELERKFAHAQALVVSKGINSQRKRTLIEVVYRALVPEAVAVLEPSELFTDDTLADGADRTAGRRVSPEGSSAHPPPPPWSGHKRSPGRSPDRPSVGSERS